MLESPQAWRPRHNNVGEWLQLDAGEEVMVSGVITQGRADRDQWVKIYLVEASVSASGPFTRVGRFAGNSDRDTKQLRMFDAPVHARYVRLVAESWERDVSMR